MLWLCEKKDLTAFESEVGFEKLLEQQKLEFENQIQQNFNFDKKIEEKCTNF